MVRDMGGGICSHRCNVPAVNQDGPHVLCPGVGGGSDEGQDRQRVFWDAHVWPLSVVIMENRVFRSLLRHLEDHRMSS